MNSKYILLIVLIVIIIFVLGWYFLRFYRSTERIISDFYCEKDSYCAITSYFKDSCCPVVLTVN